MTMRRASKAVTDFYDAKLTSCGVTVVQFGLLRRIRDLDDPSVTELAKAMDLERSTLVRTLRPLFDAGLIEDRAAPGTRNRQLRLTRSGKKVVDKGFRLWNQAQVELEKKVGSDALLVVRALLGTLQTG